MMKPVVSMRPVEDQCVYIISSDEESLPHMLSHDYAEDNDSDAEYDQWPSPMTNSVDDDRSEFRRLVEISSTSSTSSRYPQTDADQHMLNKLLNSAPRCHRSFSSCESIVTITDDDSDRGTLLEPRYSSPTDSQYSNTYHSNESNGACSLDSSPRQRSKTTPKVSRKKAIKDKQQSPISTNLRPPPSPQPPLMIRSRKPHRRSASLNISTTVKGSPSPDRSKLSTLAEGIQDRYINQSPRNLLIGTDSPLSSLAHHRKHKVSYPTHRRSVTFPDQVTKRQLESNSSMSHSLRAPLKSIHNHDDPALFSLIGARMGGHGRVCISPDVDPNLTHFFRAVSEDYSTTNNGGILKTNQHSLDEDKNVVGKTKKRHRKPSRRSRSGSRKPSERTVSERNEHPQDSTHMMKRDEDEEIGLNPGKEKINKKKSNTSLRRNRKLADKVETSNSKRLNSEKLNKSNSLAIRIKSDEQIDSDSLMPTRMEAIVEEEGAGKSSRKLTVKSCMIQ